MNKRSMDHLPLLALAMASATSVSAADVPHVEEILVTGSRIGGNVAADVGANPVRVITAEELTRTGTPTIGQFFRKEASFSGSTNNESRDEGGGGRSTVNLRGIGDAYTLVLVNGRRFAANGAADVGAIPMAAVERMEVLKSGASALYGSDAVAGVVNIILKKDYHGATLTASYGNTTEHDASQTEVSVQGGYSGDRTRLVGAATFSTRNDIQKQDRKITASRDFRAYGGPDRRSGSLALPGRITLANGSFVSLDPARFGPGSTGTSPTDYVPFSSVSAQTRQSTNEVDTLPGDERTQAWASLEHDLRDSGAATVFVEGLYNRRDQADYLWSPKYLFAPEIPASNTYNPFGQDVNAVNYIFTEPGTELYSDHLTTDWRLVAGLRGEIGAVNYEVAATRYERKFEFTEHNIISIDGFIDAITRPGANALNLFGWGANSPQQLAGLFVAPFSVTRTELTSVDGRIGAPLFELPGGTVRMAAGFEFRKEVSEEDFDPLYNEGATEYGELADSRLKRDVWSVFGEVLIPLVGEAQQINGIAALELSAAVRHEEYNDFGSTTNPQVSLRWLPFGEDWVVRASWGTSFRAPPVDVLNAAQQTFQAFSYFDPVQNIGVDPIVTTGGNPNLTPEEADTFNIGTVYRPAFVPGLSLSLDYWRIDLTNIIVEPDVQALLNGTGPGQVIRQPNGEVQVIATAANGGEQKADGFDVTASYERAIGPGQLLIDSRLSYLSSFDADLSDGLGTRRLVGRFSSFRADLSGLPRLRGALNPVWQQGPFAASYQLNYVGSYDDTFNSANPRDIGSYVTHDLQFGWRQPAGDGLLSGVDVTAGIDNFTDTDPRFIAASFDGYDRSLADYRGRFYYLQLRKQF